MKNINWNSLDTLIFRITVAIMLLFLSYKTYNHERSDEIDKALMTKVIKECQTEKQMIRHIDAHLHAITSEPNVPMPPADN